MKLAATASGLARLVAISRAPVVPAFIVREPNSGRHRIEMQDEVPMQRSGDTEADMAENTRRFVKVIEDAVRRYPEQFLWTHRRYRTRPRGMRADLSTEVTALIGVVACGVRREKSRHNQKRASAISHAAGAAISGTGPGPAIHRETGAPP